MISFLNLEVQKKTITRLVSGTGSAHDARKEGVTLSKTPDHSNTQKKYDQPKHDWPLFFLFFL